MTVIQAIILSIIEGLTEFLPVSSTGHLILAANLLRVPQTEFAKTFEIFIQLGGIMAIVVLYARRFLQDRTLWIRVIAAFIPTAIIGLTLYRFIKDILFEQPRVTVWMLILGGLLMIVLEKRYKEKDQQIKNIENLSLKQSFLVGCIQSLSIIPGVSRAAASILGGMYVGMNRTTAVEFSFFLAVPTILAATVLDLVKSPLAFTSTDIQLLGIGFVGAFVTALLTVTFLLQYIRHNTFIPFGIYRILVGILFLLFVY